MESAKRGRKRKYNYEEIRDCLQEYQNDIFYNQAGQVKVQSSKNGIWNRLAIVLKIPYLTPKNLYNFVVNNQSNFRNDFVGKQPQVLNSSNNDSSLNNSNVHSSLNNESLDDSIPPTTASYMQIPNAEFQKLVYRQVVYYKDDDGEEKKREVWRLKKFQWEPVINKYYRQKNLDSTCSFKFTNHWLNEDFTGNIIGKCNCGVEYKGYIENFIKEDTLINNTIVKNATGKKCGIDYLRSEERVQIGKEMVEKNEMPHIASVNRALHVKAKRMNPAELYGAKTLSNAKSEYKTSKNIHKCPFRSLQTLSLENYRNEIVVLSFRPFIVMYIVTDQQRNYRIYGAKDGSFVAADATGNIASKFILTEKEYTGVIFLYEIVVNDGKKQYSVFQMLTDSHSANTISYWLSTWIDLGNPVPKKFVCDGSRAFILAAVKSLTNYLSINDYVNAMFKNEKPICQICIDFAHFIHKFAEYVKNISPGLKRFILCSIGLLVLCTNKNDAGFYLESILYILISERSGVGKDGQKTMCQIRMELINEKLTGLDSSINDVVETAMSEVESSDDLTECNSIMTKSVLSDAEIDKNLWSNWAVKIELDVRRSINNKNNEIGSTINPYNTPKLAKYLMQNMSLIALWGCVTHETFIFDKKQSTSSAVESDFNNIKNRLCKNITLPTRPDNFVSTHINYLTGKLYLSNQNSETSEVIAENPPDNNFSIQNKEIPEASGVGKSQCIACADGNFPTGAHCCIKCGKKVHVFEGCSHFIGQSEGYGEKRICVSCMNNGIPTTSNKRNLQEQVSTDSCCLACLNGSSPTDDHSCVICKKFVHEIEPCSFSVPSEGNARTKRICHECKKNAPQILDNDEYEDWRGQISSQKKEKNTKQSLYLKKKHPVTAFSNIRKREINILKNGNDRNLGFVTINKLKYSLNNTCAFDTIFQIFYVAYLDCEASRSLIDSEHSTNEMFKMIYDLGFNNKITATTYQNRCKILMNHFPQTSNRHSYTIKCDSTIANIISQLFERMPSFTELYNCCKCGSSQKYGIKYCKIGRHELKNSLAEKIVAYLQCDTERVCKNADCNTKMVKTLKAGKILFVETMDTQFFGDNTTIRIQDLHQNLELEVNGKVCYKFIGCVELKSNVTKYSCIDESLSSVGHYTAVCKRCDGSFIKCDDLATNKPSSLNMRYSFMPDLLIYIQI